MTVAVLNPGSDYAEWDVLVGAFGGDTLGQSSAWGATKGDDVMTTIVGLRHEGELVAGCLLLRRRVGPVALAYAPRGPIIAREHIHRSDELIAGILRELHARRPSVVILHPSVRPPELRTALDAHGFTPAPIDIATPATVEISLTDDTAQLFGRLRSSRRRNIRRAEKAGLVVRRGTEDDLATFLELHQHTASRQGFEAMSESYLQRQWEALGESGVLSIYVAEHDGTALSAATVTAFGDRAVFKLAGLADTPLARDTRASDFLHWQIMLDAKDRGFLIYDLGGFDKTAAKQIVAGEEPPEHLRQSASQFKLGFGGTVRVLPESVWKFSPSAAGLMQAPIARAVQELKPLRSAMARFRS